MKTLFSNLIQKEGYVFRLDDIAPNMNWKMMERVKKLFNTYKVKPIIGVIPKNEDQELKSYPMCAFNFWNEIKNLKNQGWEIAMHGYEHLYNKQNNKKDYMGYGGNTEFANLAFEIQLNNLKLGMQIFREQNISVKVFFAPNHTFDQNTIKACKKIGIQSIVDGYGFIPYYEDEIIFIPQLFYKLVSFPFGIQTMQLHLNYFTEKDYLDLEKFIKKNEKKIISYSEACSMVRNDLKDKVLRVFIKKVLQLKRAII